MYIIKNLIAENSNLLDESLRKIHKNDLLDCEIRMVEDEISNLQERLYRLRMERTALNCNLP